MSVPAARLEPDGSAAAQPRPSVTVVSASVGAGHDGAARELTRQLRAAGTTVRRVDFLDLLPAGCGRLVRAAYRAELTWAPRTWGWIADATGGDATMARVSTGLRRAAGNRAMRAVGDASAAVISTYPFASQLLGRLRLEGRLAAPVLTFLTDMSVHRLWVAAGVDAHLALHPIPADQARGLGAGHTVVSGPAVDPAFYPVSDAGERLAARSAFGLPTDAPLALVVAGSWGVGAVDRSAGDIADTGLAIPVVACGRNEALRRRLRRNHRIIALGWIDNMPALIRACDLVIQNAGGLTSLEALASGVPVVTYECLPGHGRTNAAALEAAGWAVWVRERVGLDRALGQALANPLTPAFTRGGVAGTIAAVAKSRRR